MNHRDAPFLPSPHQHFAEEKAQNLLFFSDEHDERRQQPTFKT
jgi:hypothetical protein